MKRYPSAVIIREQETLAAAIEKAKGLEAKGIRPGSERALLIF